MLNLTPLAATHQAALATLAGNAAQALQSAHQLAALNLQATRAALCELAAVTRDALSAKGPAEFGTLQISALQAAPQKALAYGLQVKEILGSATLGQQGAIDAQLADAQAKFLGAVQAALKNAPRSENTLALVKSAIATANNAYEGMNKASKQVRDAMAANVAKLTQAAVDTSRSPRPIAA